MRDIDFASLNDTSGVVSAWVHGAPQGVPRQCLVCVGHVGSALVVTNTNQVQGMLRGDTEYETNDFQDKG